MITLNGSANTVTLAGNVILTVDTINETDSAAGVTIEGVQIKDSAVLTNAIKNTDDESVITLTASQMVGIGVTPSYQLHVEGSTGFAVDTQTADTASITLMNDDVGHGFTSLYSTNKYGITEKVAAGTSDCGGLYVRGFSEGDCVAMMLEGNIGATDPTDTKGAVTIAGAKLSGSDNGDLGALETILDVQNHTTSKFRVLGDGSWIANSATATSEGAGISDAPTNTWYIHEKNGIIETVGLVDIHGLTSDTGDTLVIGEEGAAAC